MLYLKKLIFFDVLFPLIFAHRRGNFVENEYAGFIEIISYQEFRVVPIIILFLVNK